MLLFFTFTTVKLRYHRYLENQLLSNNVLASALSHSGNGAAKYNIHNMFKYE